MVKGIFPSTRNYNTVEGRKDLIFVPFFKVWSGQYVERVLDLPYYTAYSRDGGRVSLLSQIGVLLRLLQLRK